MLRPHSTVIIDYETKALGRSCITGGKALRETEIYPDGFGREVCAEFLGDRHWYGDKAMLVDTDSDGEEDPNTFDIVSNDAWPDADLEAACRYLNVPLTV